MDGIDKIVRETIVSGKSYGQIQAAKHEQEQRLQQRMKQLTEATKQPEKEGTKVGRPSKQKPERFGEFVEMIVAGEITKKRAAIMLGVSKPTIRKWLNEYVSDSESCSK